MTEEERDKLLLELRDVVQRLDKRTERTERKVDRLLNIAQGQASARVESDGRLADHELRIEALEQAV